MDEGISLLSKDHELIELSQLANDFAHSARALNTRRAYASDWRDFQFWCHSKNLSLLPAHPLTVALYLSDRASNAWIDLKGGWRKPLKTSSLQRRLSAIKTAHSMAQEPFDKHHPALSETWKGIQKSLGVAPQGKSPLTIDDLKALIDHLDGGSLIEARDRAILLLGFAGAFRRSELVAITIEDLSFPKEGCLVHLRRSKTDQSGAGRIIAIPYGSNPLTCPVRTLQEWIAASALSNGPLFRRIDRHGHLGAHPLSDRSVALIIKRNGYLKERSASYAGHSLRAGFATTAAQNGASEHAIMQQTGHRKSDTLRKYIRISSLWKENAATKLGL